jgi:electron transfer flavoprotein beta subunit
VLVAACLKWVDLRPSVDPLTGAVHGEARSYGLSAADEAALEWALRLGEAWSAPVWALTAGPPDADGALRIALACGADHAARVELPTESASERIAAGLAHALASAGERTAGTSAVVVCCGDASVDRGSGSVPAFLADRLGAAQALGLVGLRVQGPPEGANGGRPTTSVGDASPALLVERRLERGRRERLRVRAPAVLSLEGATARLRRASLPGVLRAGREVVPVLAPAGVAATGPAAGGGDQAPHAAGNVVVERIGPFRPRARLLPAPDPQAPPRDRILALTGALVEHTPPRTVRVDPEEAARVVYEQLRDWGYVE